MIDLTEMANVEFYAGKPDEAYQDRLVWRAHDYYMEVRLEDGCPVARMTSGNCEWSTQVPTKEAIDAALEDACCLGRMANYSRDPER